LRTEAKDQMISLKKTVRNTRVRMRKWREFGENLKREIHESGLSGKAASDLFGINLRNLYLTQSGNLAPPPVWRLEQWAEILDVDRDLMFSWADTVSPDVIAILAEHPILCKKIRREGADSFLSEGEKRLESALLRGKKRKI
jgi:hypothetical protein